MNDLTAKLILDPPKSDLVLIISASWWVWALFALLVILLIVAFAPKTKKEGKP
jgi:uncharacterized protein involved in exopolysaccharide biosynthesis